MNKKLTKIKKTVRKEKKNKKSPDNIAEKAHF